MTSSAVVGLVGDHEQRRVQRDGRGDQRALAQAAGQLVGALAGAQVRLGTPTLGQQLDSPRRPRAAAGPGVQPQRLADLAAHRPQRVERDQRVLEDEARCPAAHPAPVPLAGVPNAVRAAEFQAHPAGHEGADRSADQRAGGHGLAGAGLADDRDALAAAGSPGLDPVAAIAWAGHVTLTVAAGQAADRGSGPAGPPGWPTVRAGGGGGGWRVMSVSLSVYSTSRPRTVVAAAVAPTDRPGMRVHPPGGA